MTISFRADTYNFFVSCLYLARSIKAVIQYAYIIFIFYSKLLYLPAGSTNQQNIWLVFDSRYLSVEYASTLTMFIFMATG